MHKSTEGAHMKKERVVIYLPQPLAKQIKELQQQYPIEPTISAVYEHLVKLGLQEMQKGAM